MGIMIRELTGFALADGRDCQIELNEGGKIHVHFTGFRIDLSTDEFLDFADLVESALSVLVERKHDSLSRT